jgi:phosphotransferase system  glucose/maltose/N-acetylglucosamine-specific IIC component
VAVARVLSTNLIHAAGSGVIGVALAMWRAEKGGKSWLWVFLGYVFASVFHMIFNTMVSTGRLWQSPLSLAVWDWGDLPCDPTWD